MWLQVALVSFLISASQVQAEDHASLRHSNDAAGRCQYTFTVSSPQETSCTGDNGRPEMEGVLSRLTLLEALVSRLIAEAGTGSDAEAGLPETFSQITGERNQLRMDKDQLSRQIQELHKRVTELSHEIESLRQKPCLQTNSLADTRRKLNHRLASDLGNDFRHDAYQEVKAEVSEVPASHLLPDGKTSSCGELLSVEEPVLHRKADGFTGKYGVWLQDPEPQGTQYSDKTVWRMDTVGKDVRRLFVYEDMKQFAHGPPMKILLLPEAVESTGATIYRGSLYYQRKVSRTLIRYDLASESLVSRRDLPHAGFHGQYPYSWGGYTDIDLAADERGLWAIYSTSKAKGAIVLSQLDPENLQVKRSWETQIRKNTVANAFMMCARLYTVASYAAVNTTINHAFDTATETGRDLSVPFQNKYGYNSMVDYNHAQRKLFAWDNFHMVSYDLRVGGASK